jgi:hypothetical protein
MNIIAGAQFKDCTSSDFEHYFCKTILLWNLSETKKRLFMCEELIGGLIRGKYLTRLREFKEKTFPLETWWKYMDVLPPYGKSFSLGTSAALWYPSMWKNLKKSYPFVTAVDPNGDTTVKFLGKPQADELTVQNVLACAFPQYYSVHSSPTLGEAIYLEGTAVAAQGDFAIGFTEKKVWLKNLVIGEFEKESKSIKVSNPLTKEILVDIGRVPAEKVAVLQ